jgi:hypothetical protein
VPTRCVPDRAGPRVLPILLTMLALLAAGCQVRIDTAVDLREDDTAVVDLTVGVKLQEGLPPEVAGGASEEAITT